MADIRAFRLPLRHGPRRRPQRCIAPPYDVIDSALQQKLYDRSPYNVIRLILNKEQPGDSDKENRYTRAANNLREWQADDVLVRGFRSGALRLRTGFRREGRHYTRRGFLARVRLEPFGSGRIYPHEETLAGPKADRLRLFQATEMNLSPVFGLYPDPDDGVMQQLKPAWCRALPLQAADHLGVVSRLWPVTDQHVVSAVTGALRAEAGLHRRRPSSLRNRSALSSRTASGRRNRSSGGSSS